MGSKEVGRAEDLVGLGPNVHADSPAVCPYLRPRAEQSDQSAILII